MIAAPLMASVKQTRTVENSITFGHAVLSFLIGSEETGGNFSLIEVAARPGTEPPYHVHQREDETFYLLEGRVGVMLDGVVHELVPGDSIFLPRGIPHTFRIRSEYSRSLAIITPSGFEGFFKMLGEPATSLEIPQPGPPPADYFERLGRASAQFGVRLADVQPVF
jgi:quercetin dioxygenase-like cupin family protein